MLFYRLQNKEYNINSQSKSFWNCYDDIEEAMEQDIKEWIIGFEPDEHWIDLNQYEIKNEEVKELYDNYSDTKALWNKLVIDSYEPRRIHQGVSCYQEDRREELKDYFEYHRPVSSSSMQDAYNEEYYILIFNGNHVGCGLDGEDLAVFEKEVKRMSVKEFVDLIN